MKNYQLTFRPRITAEMSRRGETWASYAYSYTTVKASTVTSARKMAPTWAVVTMIKVVSEEESRHDRR